MKHYFKSKQKLNVEYFFALMSIAMADGKLLEEEKEFFESRAAEFGFSMKNIEQMFELDFDELQKLASNNIDEVDFITDIVAMAMIDGELHEKEYELCVKLAQKNGKTAEDIDNTIKLLNNLIKEN